MKLDDSFELLVRGFKVIVCVLVSCLSDDFRISYVVEMNFTGWFSDAQALKEFYILDKVVRKVIIRNTKKHQQVRVAVKPLKRLEISQTCASN